MLFQVFNHRSNHLAAGILVWQTGAGFIFDAIIATLMILIAIRISPIVQRYVRRKTYKTYLFSHSTELC